MDEFGGVFAIYQGDSTFLPKFGEWSRLLLEDLRKHVHPIMAEYPSLCIKRDIGISTPDLEDYFLRGGFSMSVSKSGSYYTVTDDGWLKPMFVDKEFLSMCGMKGVIEVFRSNFGLIVAHASRAMYLSIDNFDNRFSRATVINMAEYFTRHFRGHSLMGCNGILRAKVTVNRDMDNNPLVFAFPRSTTLELNVRYTSEP